MRPEDLVAQLRVQPFQPFRIVTHGNGEYDITHSDRVHVGTSVALVMTPHPDRAGVFSDYHVVALSQIIRLVPRVLPA